MNTHARPVPPHPGLPAGPHGRVLFPPAKVNLFLDVLGKRADGYHDIATLLVPVNLYDTLEIQPSGDGELRLACHPDTIPTGPTNLVWKAAEALRREFGVTAGATMRLTKRIPHEAGLGGGSSDAAAALAGLNAVWGLKRSVGELLPAAASVGSDVPGFLVCRGSEPTPPAPLPMREGGEKPNSPPSYQEGGAGGGRFQSHAAWCTGRGEVVTPVTAGPPHHLVIVKPPVGCPTAEVYKRYRPGGSAPDSQRVVDAFARGDAEELAGGLHNALQSAAFDLQPLVRKVYDRLTNCSPLAVLLSGSGASVFAVCRDAADAAAVARRFARHTDAELAACRVFVVRTLGAMT